MIRENDSLVGDREALSSPKSRRMEYHTERIVTIEMSRRFADTLVLISFIFGVAIVAAAILSH